MGLGLVYQFTTVGYAIEVLEVLRSLLENALSWYTVFM